MYTKNALDSVGSRAHIRAYVGEKKSIAYNCLKKGRGGTDRLIDTCIHVSIPGTPEALCMLKYASTLEASLKLVRSFRGHVVHEVIPLPTSRRVVSAWLCSKVGLSRVTVEVRSSIPLPSASVFTYEY